MNIIVLVIDTLRYDHVGAHGCEWIETPNLDRLAGESWVFDRSYAASFPTIPHRTDAMTGRYGAPFHAWRPLPFDVPTLPWALGEAGYATQLIHDTPHLVNGGHNFDWPFHAWTPVRGAEVDRPWITDDLELPENWAVDSLFDFLDADAWQVPSHVSYVRANRGRKGLADWNCARLFRRASEFLADNARRESFFLWLDCFDPHEPWDAPPEFVRKYAKGSGGDGRIDPRAFLVNATADVPPEAARRVADLYAAKVSWVDRCLGELLDTLDRTRLARNTAVLLTSDHGTSLGEGGLFHKRYPVRECEGHTPFMVRIPDGGAGRSDLLVQPQDIFATVLAIAGLPPPTTIDSHDVLALAREGASPRKLALAGRPPNTWNRPDQPILFSAFDGTWCLQVAATPEASRLVAMGRDDDVAPEHGDVVARLWAEAVDELERRGTDPAVMRWVRSGGAGHFPAEARFHDGWPPPAGYHPYFERLYKGQ
jgi:arylsulfatase A-like enzyme